MVQEGFIAYTAVPLIAKGQVQGLMEVIHRAVLEPGPEWWSFFEALAGQAAIAIDNATLFEDLQRAHQELAVAYDATIEGWSQVLDLRDRETEGHSRRVTELTLRMARSFGMNPDQLVHVRRGALLHDIGKLGIPDGILLKPGPLVDEEWQVMRRHPQYALEWLSPIHYLRPALEIPHCHHERWDGTGYPRGLKGEEIPLEARIFAAVDVFDALSHDRPYRQAWPAEKVQAHLRSLAGSHLDEQVVDVLLRTLAAEPAAQSN
jgi:HD-GYP domain-containing protein (c-di-GMP phosphodiesterase class II)